MTSEDRLDMNEPMLFLGLRLVEEGESEFFRGCVPAAPWRSSGMLTSSPLGVDS